MKQQCPKCGNWVEGKRKEDLKRKATKSAVKKASSFGTAAAGAAIGSLFFPGVGTVIGGALGLLVEDDVNQLANEANDKLYGSAIIEFCCPNCGHTWDDYSSSGTDNQLAKDQLLVQQMLDYVNENTDEIYSSADSFNAFLSEWGSKEIISPVPQANMNFLLAFYTYCASIAEPSFLRISRKYINRALRTNNNKEYQLLSEVINNKDTDRNTASIVPNAIKLLADLTEDQMIFSQNWYLEQLQNAITEETNKYKDEIIRKEKVSILKKSFLCIPVFMYFYYKWSNYVAPESWFAMHWNYWYILFIIISGGIFLKGLYAIYLVYSKSKEEWQNEYISQYTPFKWSDLLK